MLMQFLFIIFDLKKVGDFMQCYKILDMKMCKKFIGANYF